MPWYPKDYKPPADVECQLRVKALEEEVALLRLEVRYLRVPHDILSTKFLECARCNHMSRYALVAVDEALPQQVKEHKTLCYRCFIGMISEEEQEDTTPCPLCNDHGFYRINGHEFNCDRCSK